jgi:uncharacterized protein (TIGR03437 family)
LDQRVKGNQMKHLRLLRLCSVLFALTVSTSYLKATVLTAATTTINLLCTMGQACTSTVSGVSTYSATSGLSTDTGTAAYIITAPSVPWLTVSPLAGTATTSSSNLTFSVSGGWTSLNAGLNSTSVFLVSGTGGNTTFTVNLEVQGATPTLIVQGGTNVLNPVPYQTGATAPALSLTLLSSTGLPLAFTVAATSNTTPGTVAGGTAPSGWLTINAGSASGIAYSWGTTIYFTASATALADSSPGDYDTGTITITPAGQTAIVIPLNIAVSAGAPTVTSVAPSLVPLLVSPVAPGSVNLVLHGTGFVATTGAQKTKVFIGATALTATQVLTNYVTVLSPNYIQVSVPYTAAGLPFATAGATALVVGVANGASPTAPSVTVPLGVTSAPIISSITSASSFVEPIAGTPPNATPYDIVSIFGTNLCPLCTGTNNVQVASPDPVFFRYPTFLSPDGTHKMTVIFSKPGSATTTLPGYLLFGTNNQINVLVPGAVSTLVGTASPNVGLVNVQVAYDTNTPPLAANTSVVFQLTYAAYDPGIFTIASNGQGQGAITDATTFVLNSQTHYATGGASTVAIFLTGLGIPDATGTNTATTNAAWSAGNCLTPLGAVGTASNAPGGYMGTVNTPASVGSSAPYYPGSSYVVPSPLWSSIDGAIIQTSLLQGNFAPCLLFSDASATNTLTVTIGTTALTAVSTPAITYAGFVAGSIAGLYQINVPIPTGIGNGTTAAQFPVVVTLGTTPTSPIPSSQSGVTMWIK